MDGTDNYCGITAVDVYSYLITIRNLLSSSVGNRFLFTLKALTLEYLYLNGTTGCTQLPYVNKKTVLLGDRGYMVQIVESLFNSICLNIWVSTDLNGQNNITDHRVSVIIYCSVFRLLCCLETSEYATGKIHKQ